MYQRLIRDELERTDHLDADSIQVEAWMRLEHGTLDALSLDQFRREVQLAAVLTIENPAESLALAETY